MSPHKSFIVALVLGVSIIGASTYPAAGAGMKMPGRSSQRPMKPSQDTKGTPEPQRTTIALISGSSISISTGKENKTYTIDQDTQIELKGSRATVADLKPGMRVSITPGVEASHAGLILASDPPKAPSQAGSGKGKK